MDEVIKQATMKPKGSSEEYTTPFDVVFLPSKGLLYSDPTLAGKESLECHYLTAIQEDILTSPNLLTSGKMLDVLLKSVLKDKKIDPAQLTLGDRNAIVIWLRSTGYGSDYPVQVRCEQTQCGHEWTHEFDLSTLSIRELEEKPDEDGLFSFEMPLTKKKIRFKFLTSEDELIILKKVEAVQKKQGSAVDHSMSFKMMATIVEVDGVADGMVVKQFVESLPVKDARSFREHLNSIEPGVIMTQECECPVCNNVALEVIPIRGNFFWPDSGI